MHLNLVLYEICCRAMTVLGLIGLRVKVEQVFTNAAAAAKGNI